MQLARSQARAIANQIPGFDQLEPQIQEEFIDNLLFVEGLTVRLATQKLLVFMQNRTIDLSERPSLVPERPNVLFDWEGIHEAFRKAAFVMLKRLDKDDFVSDHRWMKSGAAGLWRRKSGIAVDTLLAGRSMTGTPATAFWRIVHEFALPQWSKGRKDQPDNARKQRKPPRNPFKKPHRSPLGEHW